MKSSADDSWKFIVDISAAVLDAAPKQDRKGPPINYTKALI